MENKMETDMRLLAKGNYKAEYMERAIQYISLNYDSDLTVNKLAEQVALSRAYMTRIFQSELKISPKQYIVRRRMDRACELLRTTDLPISVVCKECGINSASNFSAQFKRLKGLSPTKYREENRSN